MLEDQIMTHVQTTFDRTRYTFSLTWEVSLDFSTCQTELLTDKYIKMRSDLTKQKLIDKVKTDVMSQFASEVKPTPVGMSLVGVPTVVHPELKYLFLTPQAYYLIMSEAAKNPLRWGLR